MANETSNTSAQAFFPFDTSNGIGLPFDGNTPIALVAPEYNTINKIVAALQSALSFDKLIITQAGGLVYDANGTIVTKS